MLQRTGSAIRLSALVSYLLTHLLGRPAVDCSTDLVPSHVGIGEESLVDRCGGCQGEHDGSKRAKLIVHLPALGDILGLECDL